MTWRRRCVWHWKTSYFCKIAASSLLLERIFLVNPAPEAWIRITRKKCFRSLSLLSNEQCSNNNRFGGETHLVGLLQQCSCLQLGHAPAYLSFILQMQFSFSVASFAQYKCEDGSVLAFSMRDISSESVTRPSPSLSKSLNAWIKELYLSKLQKKLSKLLNVFVVLLQL